VNPTLQGYAAAALEGPANDAAALAGELEAVDRALFDNQVLRSALTDNVVAGPARRAVLEEVLDGKVSARARRAAGFAAGAVSAPDVPAAISWLAHRARLAADEGELPPEAALGHREARDRVGGFASFVLEDVPVDRLDEIEDELFRFARIVESTPALKAALTDRDLVPEVRRGVVDQLLNGKAQPETIRLADYVVVGGRARDVVGTLDWLVVQTAKARGWRVARVRAAAEVAPPERQRLADSLSRIAGSAVELQVTVDPALLAGVVVEVGDLQVDASALGRLNDLREHLSVAGWDRPGTGEPGSGLRDDEEGAS
jgi:F-type H+-transporting ATPase subunit delta